MFRNALIIFGIISLAIITECFEAYIFESKMLSYLLYFCLFILGYMFMKRNKEKNRILETYTDNDKKKVKFEGFIPSGTFVGHKSGYVFKTDNKGTGYYLE